jgi:hypothetical protein
MRIQGSGKPDIILQPGEHVVLAEIPGFYSLMIHGIKNPALSSSDRFSFERSFLFDGSKYDGSSIMMYDTNPEAGKQARTLKQRLPTRGTIPCYSARKSDF